MLNLKWPVSMFALFNHFCLFPGDNFKSPTTQPGQWGWGRGWPIKKSHLLLVGRTSWLRENFIVKPFRWSTGCTSWRCFGNSLHCFQTRLVWALYRTICHLFTTSQICPQKPCFIILSLYLKFVIFVDSPKSAGDKYQVCLSYLYCDNK